MSFEPPFERYPGPSSGRRDLYRVISPLRDVVAWISASGRISLVRLLVRDGTGWSGVVDRPFPQEDAVPSWALAWRDPVELAFMTRPETGIDATAFVTVGPDGCRVSIEPAAARARARQWIAEGDALRIADD